MFRNAKQSLAALTALLLGAGCGASTPPPGEPRSMSSYRQTELQAEREDFISDTEERLGELDNEIAHLDVKLQHESRFVDEDQRADWRQEVFERKQEQTRLRAELDRARGASPAEWEAMRGTIGSAVDTLEAGVKMLTDRVTGVFASSEERAPVAGTDAGLCGLDVPEVETDVSEENGAVILTVTTAEQEGVQQLRGKAQELAQAGTYGATGEPSGQPSTRGIAVEVSTENVPDGVKITLRPKDPAHLAKLREAVDRDASYLGGGDCAETPTGTAP